MKRKLYVLLGDVISSTRISDRDNFQQKLGESCREINASYAGDIYADFEILKGLDEIGGVLSNMSNSYEIITTLLDRLYPNSMRFALVFDYIDTALVTMDVAKMDGPAFHKASNIISGLKKSKQMFDMSIGDEILDITISGLIDIILVTKKNWSAKQHQIVMEHKKGNKQSEIAKKFGITQQAVSKTLKSSMWKEIKDREDDLKNILRLYMQMQKDAGSVLDV